MQGFDGFSGGAILEMDKGKNDVVRIVSDRLILLVEVGKVDLLEEVAQAAAHDDFLVLAVAGELAFDIEVEKLLQFGSGVRGQHGSDLAEMENCLARANKLLEDGDSSLSLAAKHQLGRFLLSAANAGQFFKEAAESGFENVEIEFGEEVGDAFVLAVLKGMAEVIHFGA